jgi:mannosyl-oligosaccharide alpha-1,2-mannosidase
MGAGQSADYAEYSQEIPHFDREGHLRTQRRQESRKRAKMKGTVMEDAMPSSSLVGQFFLVGGLIVFGAWFPFWLAKTVSGGRREKKEKKEKSAAA